MREICISKTDETDKKFSGNSVITSDRLMKLPKSWIIELEESAVTSNCSQAEIIVNKIWEQDRELANALIKLISEFRFDILQHILKNVQEC